MYSLALLALVSFGTSLLLTPLFRDLFAGLGIVDAPDQARKTHTRPIPRVGGVPVALAFSVAFVVLLLTNTHAGHRVEGSLPMMIRVLPAVALVFLTGLLDDLLSLRPWQKLLGQTVAAGLAYWAGVQITGFVAFQFTSVWLTLPITVIWLVGCTNAFNLIDGVDGLAAGVGLFATVSTLVAALVHQDIGLAMATVPLAGALLGFLRYNFNPASIFLGDCGSLSIGFLLGCYSILWSQKSATLLGMTAPLMILAVPLLDTTLSVVRRFLRQQPIFGADRGHIHHRLLDRGLTPRRVTLVIYGVCGVAAVFSLLQVIANDHFGGIIIVLFCLVTWVGVQNLGYPEFGVAGRMLSRGVFRHMLKSEIHLQQMEASLAKASSIEESVTIIAEGAQMFGFDQLRVHLNGSDWEWRQEEYEEAECWELRIPITPFDYVVFLRSVTKPMLAVQMASFTETVRKGLRFQMDATAESMFAFARTGY